MPVRKEAEKVTGIVLSVEGHTTKQLTLRVHRGGYGPHVVVRVETVPKINQDPIKQVVELTPTVTELIEFRDALTELLEPYE